ncbi:MAG TPA: tetratricopeptide repeat protein [Bacteroidia bacterium]|nr:tetratricopeptide repeat protein [Bacteroidia bacterium]
MAGKANRADSLINLLKKNLPDTERVNILNRLCYEKYLSDVNSAFPYGTEALRLAKKINYKKGAVLSLIYISYLEKSRGDFTKAFLLADSALAVSKKEHYDNLTVKALNQKGNLYGDNGNLARSLSFYLEAAGISEKNNDKKALVGTYANIGINFISLRQFEKSEEYLRKAIIVSEGSDDLKSVGNLYNNMGAMFLESNKLDSAEANFKKGQQIYTRAKYTRGLAYSMYYLGFIYNRTKNYKAALESFEKAGEINKESGNSYELSNIYNCIADVYISMNKPDQSLQYAKKSLEEALREKSGFDIKEAYLVLKKSYELKGDYETALEYYSKYTGVKDSLFNTESSKQVAEMQTKYETEKKETENKLLQEKNESSTKTIKQQRYFGIAVGIICILLVAFAIVIFRSNKQKQRINVELERKNILIERQKELVEEKQKEILDSIHYAKRIQRSLLTSEKYIARNLNKLSNKN